MGSHLTQGMTLAKNQGFTCLRLKRDARVIFFFEWYLHNMVKKIHRFLVISGAILFVLGIIRLYRVIRMHEEDPLFAPHLLGASLSAWIAYSLLKIGLKKREFNRKRAIRLIRSGSIFTGHLGLPLFPVSKKP